MKSRCNAQARPSSAVLVSRDAQRSTSANALRCASRLTKHFHRLLAALLILLVTAGVKGETILPLVDEVEWGPFRDHCRPLLKKMEAEKSPLSAQSIQAVRGILDQKPDDPEAAVRAVQKHLDRHCLIAVSINPESRVKASRGPAVPSLYQDRETLVLIKVHNEGGVTHPLRLRGPEIIPAGEREDDDHWLRAALVTEAPFGNKLSGRRLEYRLLRLRPRQAGKREATFQFDVGQGTQDLGFRAEVPILFSIGKARRD